MIRDMADSIYCKPFRNDSLRQRLVHRFENLLCRIGLHDWCEWYESKLWGGPSRSCNHCTRRQIRRI